MDGAVQSSILLLAADGGEPVAGPTPMRMMVFLLKKVGLIAGRGLGGTDAHARCGSGDIGAELRHLSDAGAVRCGRSGIERPSRAARLPPRSRNG